MRITVIGAGIVGVTTAHALASEGHEVTVLERRGSVATEGSFANAGLLSPGLVGGWGPEVLMESDHGRATQALLNLGRSLHRPAQLGWWWRAWRAGRPAWQANRRLQARALAHLTRDHLQDLTTRLDLQQEQRQGCLVLLRQKREVGPAKAVFERLAEQGELAEWLSPEQAREVEPGLNPKASLQAALHLRDDGVANSRQIVHLLKADAQALGARFCFDRTVLEVRTGPVMQVLVRREGHPLSVPMEPSLAAAASASADDTDVVVADAVVLCTGLGSPKLMQSLGLSLPLLPIHGHTITAPLPLLEAHPDLGPRAGLIDLQQQVTISRLGDRIRVSGGLQRGRTPAAASPQELGRLYKVLDHWFEGVARTSRSQEWHGGRPCLPDGFPAIGPSSKPGIWLNLGHGNFGWTWGLGAGMLLTDLLMGRTPRIDATAYHPARFL